MRRSIKKAACALLCLTTVVSLGACQQPAAPSGAASSGTPSQAASSQAAEPADPLGKYEPGITVTAVRSLDSNVKFDTTNPERESVEKNVWQTAYQEQLGIQLSYLWTPNTEQYSQKWNVAIASGDIPDIGVVDATMYKQLVEGNLVEDMTDVYDQYAGDQYKNANESDNGNTISYMTFNGRMLGLPQTGNQPDNVNLMFIRRDWLDKVGKEVPKTIDELVEVATAFQEAKLGGDSTIGIAASKSILGGENCLAGFFDGYNVFYKQWIDDGSGALLYGGTNLETIRPALLKLQEMYQKGLFVQDFAVKDSSQSGQDVVAGKCGISFGTFWAPLGTISNSIQADEKAVWECVPLPTADGSAFKTSASAAPGGYVFVKKGMEHPEAAVKILNLNFKLNDEENTKYGITEDGFDTFKFRFASDLSMPWKNLTSWTLVQEALKSGDTAKMSPDDLNSYDFVKRGMGGERAMNGYVLVFGPDGTFKQINDAKNDNRILVDAYRGLPTATMLSKKTDLDASLDAAALNVIMGADISTYDKAVEAWKASGGDQMTKEVNDWYAQSK